MALQKRMSTQEQRLALRQLKRTLRYMLGGEVALSLDSWRAGLQNQVTLLLTVPSVDNE